ncbi:MAG: response regulator transcription factor [Clostridiales bacterium]|nr:response regulator transcription factor [Clostridiales bacterium]
MKKILIIEDDVNILTLEKDYLQKNNFEVETALDGAKGLSMALERDYDLVLLDIMLPRVDGLQVCKTLREHKDIPILLVSAKKDDLDKIRGLGFGADDYIVKPFSPSELVARVFAHISRYNRLKTASAVKDEKPVIEQGNLSLDPAARRALVNGKEVNLTNKEFDLLYYLAASPDVVYSKEELLSRIWRYDALGEASTVTVHVNRIRDKIKLIDPAADYIHTVWGKGYRFK